MDYKDAIHAESQYHFDELPEPTQEALYAAAAADKLNEVFSWLIGRGARNKFNARKARVARVYVLGVIIGRWTQAEAAKEAGVHISGIEKHKAEFCALFGVEKVQSNPVKGKGE
jgi:hypothetical protein